MKVVIPPSIRRIMQALPPIQPLSIALPTPPQPPPGLDLKLVIVQLLAVFLVASLVIQLNRGFGVLVLIVGLLAVVAWVLLLLRRQIRPNQKEENEYIQALANYAQAEKIYHDRLAEEHTLEKIIAHRKQELVNLKNKLPILDFVLSDQVKPLSFAKITTNLEELGHLFHQPKIIIPSISEPYVPQFILQDKERLITIVVDKEDIKIDEYLMREFFSQRGIIWILLGENETEQLQTEIDQIWQTIGL